MTAEGPQTQFGVKVRTGTATNAGTDSNIDLTLYLADGANVQARLNPLLKGDVFENGDTDVVVLTVVGDPQEVYRISVRSDGKYPGASWNLDSIEVKNLDPTLANVPPAKFTYRTWIEGDETGAALKRLTRDRDDIGDIEKRTGKASAGLKKKSAKGRIRKKNAAKKTTTRPAKTNEKRNP